MLIGGRGADEVAGLQVLRGGAGNCRGRANYSANHQCQHFVIRRRPPGHKKDRARSHERSDAHAADWVGGIAEQPADARRHGNKEEAEDGDENTGQKIVVPLRIRALHRMKRQQRPHHGDDEDRADDDPAHGDVAVDSRR